MTLIDTHSHIYSVDFDGDRGDMIERADKEMVIKILQPAIDSSTHENMMKLEAQFPQKCISMIGLHPCSVLGNYDEELRVIEGWLAKKKIHCHRRNGP
jgi:TatD DNase family protein